MMILCVCTSAFHSLDSPGLPGRIIEGLLNDNSSAPFLSAEEYCCWAVGERIIFLAGSMASTELIRLSVGKI